MKFSGIYNYVMKKIIICAIVLLLGLFIVFKRVVTFNWVNPYTYTGSYVKIAETIRGIDKGLNFARKYSVNDGLEYEYIFENAYGSGFLNNNLIPNDLDYSVGLNLGEYVFDGTNSKEIAQSVVEKMNSFQYLFNYYVNLTEDKKFYVDKSQLEILGETARQRKTNIKAISENLANAVSGKEYINHTMKTVDDGSEMDLPYVMRPYEILIENYEPIMLYSDVVSYNKTMPRYVRSISIIPEFFITIKHNDKDVLVEIVPESFLGERMQLARRFFASSTFTGNKSKKFLKNLSYINDDEKYLYYRMISYKRHLQEISNIQVMKDRPVKMLKRIMQTADIASPLLDKETMDDISQTVLKNMQNRDIQLLNEYSNICTNLLLIQEHPNLYLRLLRDGKIKTMYNVLLSTVKELEERGNVKDVYSLIEDKDKLDKYTVMFNKIYTDAGYHRVSLYWLDENTIGILKDDFTKNIKDLKKFAKDNNLADVNYKLVNASQVPKITVRYAVWARYNPTKLEQENFEKMNKAFLDDKKNFKIKTRYVF